jgi:hypothetical protein
MDAVIVRGDRTALDESPRVFGRQFLERAVDIEQVALGAYFATHALRAEWTGVIAGRMALRQPPALSFPST